MKTIQRNIILSLFPLLTPLSAFAQSEKQVDVTPTLTDSKVNVSSWRASHIIGLDVKNNDNASIGEVKDLVLDMKEGKILAVVISSGGFLGIADTLSTVPVSALRYDKDTKTLKTNLTKEQLGKAPQFKSDSWPDYDDATSKEAIRTYLEAIGIDVTAPDNAAQNKTENHEDSLNPTDQGDSDKDIQITKDIRAAIMDTDMSFNAKNIKIITRNEYVALKGVVGSDKEHQEILKIARSHANTANITDELKVDDK